MKITIDGKIDSVLGSALHIHALDCCKTFQTLKTIKTGGNIDFNRVQSNLAKARVGHSPRTTDKTKISFVKACQICIWGSKGSSKNKVTQDAETTYWRQRMLGVGSLGNLGSC